MTIDHLIKLDLREFAQSLTPGETLSLVQLVCEEGHAKIGEIRAIVNCRGLDD